MVTVPLKGPSPESRQGMWAPFVGGYGMCKIKCDRCRAEEYIPTHQFVKFDDGVHYLCCACWDLFKAWYYRGARAEPSEATA